MYKRVSVLHSQIEQSESKISRNYELEDDEFNESYIDTKNRALAFSPLGKSVKNTNLTSKDEMIRHLLEENT